jgi:hypothetical protein
VPFFRVEAGQGKTVKPPPKTSFPPAGLVHATDESGTPLCLGQVDVDEINELEWARVSPEQRCPACHVAMGAIA